MVYLRYTLRIIAYTNDRYLFYTRVDDISEQRESLLREQEATARIHAIVSNIDCGVTAVTFENEKINILFANDLFYKMMGFDRISFNKETPDIYALIHPDDIKIVKKAVSRCYKLQQGTTIEYRVIKRDAQVMWIRNSISFSRFMNEELPVQLSIFTDITKERIAEELIKQNDAELQFLNHAMKEMIDDIPGAFTRCQINDDGSLTGTYVNKGFSDMLGWSVAEALHALRKNGTWAMHPDDIHRVIRSVAEMKASLSKKKTVSFRLCRMPF